MDRKAERATFEDTIKAQTQLRQTLKKLKNQNNPTTEIETDKQTTRNNIAWACLGLEVEHTASIPIEVSGPTKPKGEIKTKTTRLEGTISELIDIALSSNDNTITVTGDKKPGSFRTKPTGEIAIRKVWETILQKLEVVVFPKARNLALRISPESKQREGPSTKDW